MCRLACRLLVLSLAFALLLPVPSVDAVSPASVPSLPLARPAAWQAAYIAAGWSHNCIVTTDGGLLCWGDNGAGELGDGTDTNRSAPVAVSGLDSGVTAVTAGLGFTCALASGEVKCWGSNSYGELGDGTTTYRSAPVPVVGLAGSVTAIAAGEHHACAVVGGGVKCWGENASGQLGNGATANTSTPVPVNGLSSGVSGIAAGGRHTCASMAAGGAKCWGENLSGELGDGSTSDRHEPVAVSGLAGVVTSMAAGSSHTCALAGGGVMCWGDNVFGQLGDGTKLEQDAPVAVNGLAGGVTAIAAGNLHTCALAGGGIKCWGRNDLGQLGDGSTANKSTPGDVNGLPGGMTALAAGWHHTCAVTSTGGVKCWGSNEDGQLGNDTSADKLTPAFVVGLSAGVTAISAGAHHTCAAVSGATACWGENYWGSLGDGSANNRSTPVAVSGLGSGATAVAAGFAHSCAVANGAASCWGYGLNGELGDGATANKLTPTAVSGLGSGVTAISAGSQHTCAVVSGAAKCWGANGYGQLGDGTTANKSAPVEVSGLGGGVTAIVAGGTHTCALTAGGIVKCWGENTDGQLGDGTTANKSAPVEVSGLGGGVTALSAGWNHTCAVTAGGAVKCWGQNLAGQLGNGTETNSSLPVPVSGLTGGATHVAGGTFHTCALTAGGAVRCWGSNLDGELGDGTLNGATTPVGVSGLASGVISVTAGGSHTCALTASGAARCWGDNEYGQLGDGTAWSTTPVDVSQGGSVPGGRAVYLPLLRTSAAPLAGYWRSPAGGSWFTVQTDRGHVINYAVRVDVSGCGVYVLTKQTAVPITGGSFAFAGTYYASGAFDTSTSESGQFGLDGFYISGCGSVTTKGPVAVSHTWQSAMGAAASGEPAPFAAAVTAGEMGAVPPADVTVARAP